jgi:S-adenosylmethionine hydrolase
MTHSIVFLSDFGYRNEWVGICHAVMDKVAPGVRVVDLSHGVPPLDVRAGALVLADSLPFIRHDAVVLAVVDPSVGRDRDLALRTGDGRVLVGPRQRATRPGLARVRGSRRSGVDHVVGSGDPVWLSHEGD